MLGWGREVDVDYVLSMASVFPSIFPSVRT